ncbi:MAG TPA: bifunctional alpha,alpha-trehalose-phosphate synthase (UDP-forming)/trehalose-phosphatase [Polyangiaceae bacterium]|nr:bifunctional alpha,alpha-trehalose-phosphate synthase (UDP-forming)/trehalose-phosphatase [Polyangiaceae bacterium]
MSRLIVVSNRLPFTLRAHESGFELTPSAGGLVTALGSYLVGKQREDPDFECVWVGWPGGWVTPEQEEAVKRRSFEEYRAHPVFLTPEDVDNFYHGFSNKTLWPLFHYSPSYVEYDPKYWDSYVHVNTIFRDAILEVYRPGDVIWVHDYQLLLLPGMLRDALPEASIGFFLHIPFPAHEIFRLMPGEWKRSILSGMLGADLIGFHTHDYTQYFLHCVFRVLGHDHHLGQIAMEERVRRADTFPIGIDFDRFMDAARSEPVTKLAEEILSGIRGRKAIFSVDRLDYTKGLLNRLRGYEEFLIRYPEWRGQVVFLLTVVPSREEVAQYQRMKQELDERVGQINGQFGTMEWVPIVYSYRSLEFETLSALYVLSPVALITPLRDGMNLVAKEYLASKPDGTGVLILSEMAGAARELGEALLINPNHFVEIADALHQALTMDSEEQVRRNRPMQERLRAYDSRRWAEHFLSSLARVKAQQGQLATRQLTPALQEDVVRVMAEAKKRLVLLDYDGTLVPFASQPHLAAPDPELLALLGRLSESPGSLVFLISGRDKVTLGEWFRTAKLGIIAEHGASIREENGKWRHLKPLTTEWKGRLRPILRMYVDQVAGSLLEEKEFSLAWHYRRCDPELGAQRAKELIDEVTQFTANLDVQVLEGKKVVEIRNSGVNKGAAALAVASELRPDRILAIGDDQTDEDLFRALPAEAITIRVGTPFSHARYSLNTHRDVRALLDLLARRLS